MALDNFYEGTRVEEIELVLDLGLKQNVLEKLALWVLGRFFLCLMLWLLTVLWD